jgi:hypothetical protein
MEGSFQEVGLTDRQTDIIEEEEEDASTFSVDLEKPRQKRRKRKRKKKQLKDPDFWPGLSEQARAQPNSLDRCFFLFRRLLFFKAKMLY